MRQSFPWHSLFRLAMAQGLAPDDLWQMTPAEIIAGLALPTASGSNDGAMAQEMTQEMLDRLLSRYGSAAASLEGDDDRQ